MQRNVSDKCKRSAMQRMHNECSIQFDAEFGVEFDVYFLESSLYEKGKVEATVEKLVANGHTYEKDGAMWLRTTDFGDDKDRVMRKREGGYTYFLPDVAYHTGGGRTTPRDEASHRAPHPRRP